MPAEAEVVEMMEQGNLYPVLGKLTSPVLRLPAEAEVVEMMEQGDLYPVLGKLTSPVLRPRCQRRLWW